MTIALTYRDMHLNYPHNHAYDAFVKFNDKKIKIISKTTHIKGTKNPTKPLYKPNL